LGFPPSDLVIKSILLYIDTCLPHPIDFLEDMEDDNSKQDLEYEEEDDVVAVSWEIVLRDVITLMECLFVFDSFKRFDRILEIGIGRIFQSSMRN